MFKAITRTVFLLSLVSFFTDVASEMLYPVMPIYLKTIGFSVLIIGILEGVAEATAGLSKGYFGRLSDISGKRLPFVRWGYFLSALSKPMMAIFSYPMWIFLARTFDRFGKGVRTGARDAILSSESTSQNKGKVFGFHRGMDTFGAVLGPAMALVFLHFYPKQYATLFFIAFAPGILSVLLTFLLKEKEKKDVLPMHSGAKPSFNVLTQYWQRSPAAYRKLVFGLLIFALFNSSDFFLLLKVKESGLEDSTVITIYIFYNLVYALFSYPVGILADRIGLKAIFICGLALFAATYFSFALSSDKIVFYALFFVYGLYAASTEGISKAWISNLVDKKETATAIGFYSGFQSLCSMAASTLTGVLWFSFGAEAALISSALFASLTALYFLFIVPSPKASSK